MHYYTFNIGDYVNNTKHLDLMEDLAYRRLLDHYYDTEKPLNLNVKKLSRLICMAKQQKIIENVLEEFFEETDQGYVQKRVQLEIDAYHSKADVARANGKKGGRPKKTQAKPKKTQPVNLANPTLTQQEPNPNPEKSESKAKQETITNNQELIKNKQKDLSDKSDDVVKQIFDHWLTVMNKNPKTTKFASERKKVIQARLKDYDADFIKKAISGCATSNFHMNRGSEAQGKFHNELTLICRNSSNLERFALMADGQQSLSYDKPDKRGWGDDFWNEQPEHREEIAINQPKRHQGDDLSQGECYEL